jgi:hypothetical protein
MSLDLTIWDEAVEAAFARERQGEGVIAGGATAVKLAAPHVWNGFYTLTFPDGSHRTFRVHTQKVTARFAPGQRVISLLVGPENTTDYEGVAFLNDDGVAVWRRHRGMKVEEHLGKLWRLMNGEEITGHEIAVSKRCFVCNRTLTDPISLNLGIGPTCRERMQHGG